MAGIFNLELVSRTFMCPVCGNATNTSQVRCPSCDTLIDSAAAEVAADRLATIDQACSDASFIRIIPPTVLGVILPALGLILKAGIRLNIPWAVGLSSMMLALYCASLLMAAGMLGVLAMTTRWWFKFSDVRTEDQEFVAAKKWMIVAPIGSALFILLVTVITLRIRGR
jgi:hypothetical protein